MGQLSSDCNKQLILLSVIRLRGWNCAYFDNFDIKKSHEIVFPELNFLHTCYEFYLTFLSESPLSNFRYINRINFPALLHKTLQDFSNF